MMGCKIFSFHGIYGFSECLIDLFFIHFFQTGLQI
nr:MAG TPA: hypothetical protein [Caudoviricetes sp.]